MNQETQKPIVVVDIDGVLFNTPVDAVASYNKKYSSNYKVSDIFNHHAEHDKKRFVVNDEDQFHAFQLNISQYKEVEGAKRAIDRLAKKAKIIALTSRNYDKFYIVTNQIIKDYFGNSISEVYFTTQPSSTKHREKGEIVKELGGNVLIDDAVKYCESAIAFGIPAILMRQAYNISGHGFPKEYTADNWSQAIVLVEKILNI